MIGDGSGQIPDMSFFTGMLTGTTGWFKIPISGFGSLICQFGLTPIGATRAVTFPIPFPSAVLGVIHFDHGFNSTVGGSTWGTGNRTRFGFTGYCNTPSEGGSYLAWGI
ncbi:gp53-like domain-containing protein [Pragia fontium]|nr:hypothetical protein [Pragia fontium]